MSNVDNVTPEIRNDLLHSNRDVILASLYF